MRVIVGITGATGAIYGMRLLERLREAGAETHLVISRWGARTLLHETSWSRERVEALASVVHAPGDMGAAISSGSFRTDGMVIAPCSAKTLAAIAHGFGENLIHRAADVVLKERRRLVLVVREAPLSDIHLENMLKLSRMGAVILPPMPAFYNNPRTVDDVIDYTVARILDQFDIQVESAMRWSGDMGVGRESDAVIETPARLIERALRIGHGLRRFFRFASHAVRLLIGGIRGGHECVVRLRQLETLALGLLRERRRFLQRRFCLFGILPRVTQRSFAVLHGGASRGNFRLAFLFAASFFLLWILLSPPFRRVRFLPERQDVRRAVVVARRLSDARDQRRQRLESRRCHIVCEAASPRCVGKGAVRRQRFERRRHASHHFRRRAVTTRAQLIGSDVREGR